MVWSCLLNADTRLPKKVLHGQVKGTGVVGRPRKIWNDVLLSDIQSLNIAHPHSDAHKLQQICLEGKDCHRTHLAHAGMRFNCYLLGCVVGTAADW